MSGIDDENPFGVSHFAMSYHVIHQVLFLKEKSVEWRHFNISFAIRADSRNDLKFKWKY